MSQSYQNSTQVTIPPELVAIDQWLAYQAVPKPNGKINKPPIDAKTGRAGSSTNPATWSTYELAATRSPVGAAFVLTADDPYFAVDLDTCVDPETGEIEPSAQDVIDRFPIYWEVSYSGRGLRGIGRGVLPGSRCRTGDVEVYDSGRYVVMTGRTLPGHETIRSCQSALTTWYREVFPPEPDRPIPPPSPPSSSNSLNLDDLLTKAFGAKNGDKARRLFDGDISGYPESQNDPGFSSEADLALAGYYCFWTQDDGLVAEAMRSSKLYRKKLDRQDYIDRTIQRVRTNQTARYDPNFGKSPQPPKEPATHVGASRDVDAMNCDDVRTQLKAAQGQIIQLQAQLAAKDTQIASQAKVIRYERGLRKGVETVLASTELQIGPRATLAALYLELAEQQARGREPAEYGHQIPAVWLARRNGLSTDAVGGHLRQLAAQGLIERRVENVSRGEDFVDLDTGEVVTLETPRKAGFINMQPEAIITNITDYRRQKDDPKHGGQQTPKPYCETHPNAGTVTHIITECAEPGCGAVLNHQRTEQEPTEIFGPNLAATGTDNEAQHVGSNLRAPEHGDLPSPYPRVVNPLDRGKSPCSESPPFRTPNRPYISPPSSTAERLRANGFSD